MATINIDSTWYPNVKEQYISPNSHVLDFQPNIIFNVSLGSPFKLYGEFTITYKLNGETVHSLSYSPNGKSFISGTSYDLYPSNYEYTIDCGGVHNLLQFECSILYAANSNDYFEDELESSLFLSIADATQTQSVSLTACEIDDSVTPTSNPVYCQYIDVDDVNNIIVKFYHEDKGSGLEYFNANIDIYSNCEVHGFHSIYSGSTTIYGYNFDADGYYYHTIKFADLTNPTCYAVGTVSVNSFTTNQVYLDTQTYDICYGQVCVQFNDLVDSNVGTTSLVEINDVQVDKDTNSFTVTVSHTDNGNGLRYAELRAVTDDGQEVTGLFEPDDLGSGDGIYVNNSAFDFSNVSSVTVYITTYAIACSTADYPGDTDIGTVEKTYTMVVTIKVNTGSAYVDGILYVNTGAEYVPAKSLYFKDSGVYSKL